MRVGPVALRASVLLALLLAAGCGREAAGPASSAPRDDNAPPAHGDAFVEGKIGEGSNLIPMLASDQSSHEYASNIFDGLLAYDKTLSTLEPRLAESWDIEDGGQKITFHL